MNRSAFGELAVEAPGERPGTCDIFAFLTTDTNAVVAPIHPRLCRSSCGPSNTFVETLVLQRPLRDGAL
jgi:hypothetical protein